MTTPKSGSWPRAEALAVAEDLIILLRPACERIEVAGSIRRRKTQVGDIELLAISKTSPVQMALSFDRPRLERSHLDARVLELIVEGILDYRLDKRGRRSYGPKNKQLIHIPSGVHVDLFSTTMDNFGMSWIVRTGPAEFNIKMMARLKAIGLQGHVNQPIQDLDGNPLPCPSEEDVFRLLGWRYLPPEERR